VTGLCRTDNPVTDRHHIVTFIYKMTKDLSWAPKNVEWPKDQPPHKFQGTWKCTPICKRLVLLIFKD
jgi:hypothetical protein